MRNKSALMIAAMALMASPVIPVQRREPDWWGDRQEPVNTGRRAEKDAIALAKAEAKRQRRAVKRLNNMMPNVEVSRNQRRPQNDE